MPKFYASMTDKSGHILGRMMALKDLVESGKLTNTDFVTAVGNPMIMDAIYPRLCFHPESAKLLTDFWVAEDGSLKYLTLHYFDTLYVNTLFLSKCCLICGKTELAKKMSLKCLETMKKINPEYLTSPGMSNHRMALREAKGFPNDADLP